MKHFLFFTVTMFYLCCHSLAAEEKAQPITPADVFLRVQVLEAELSLIRHEMGRQLDASPEFLVQKALPRHVLFQAHALEARCNRLVYEHTFEQMDTQRDLPEEEIAPKDVKAVIERALRKARKVKKSLHIPETVDESRYTRDPAKVPSDVYVKIVKLNRQVDLLLDKPYTTSDAYQVVTRSIAYASGVLNQVPNIQRIPEAPSLERGKLPADVAKRLQHCYQQIVIIDEAVGSDYLLWQLDSHSTAEWITPGIVHDVATMIESELAYLNHKLQTGYRLRRIVYPGKKTPSDVYQRVGILEQQLAMIVEQAKQGAFLQPNNPR